MSEPRDPNFEDRIRRSFERQRLMHTMGAVLLRVSAGEVELELPYRDELTQQHGFLHAGVVAAVADSACGYAALSLMPEEAAVLSVEFKLNLLAPAVGEKLRARGRVRKSGRTIFACEGEVFAIEGGSEKLVAIMLATMMAVRNRPELRD